MAMRFHLHPVQGFVITADATVLPALFLPSTTVERDSFQQQLFIFTQNKSPLVLKNLRKLIFETSKNKQNAVLASFFSDLFELDSLYNADGKHLLLHRILPLFIESVTHAQLATIFLEQGYRLLVYLLQPNKVVVVTLYLACFQKLLAKAVINPRQYESTVLAPEVIASLSEEKALDVNLVRVYLDGLMPALQSRRLRWRLNDYLCLLWRAERSIENDEVRLIHRCLRQMKVDFSAQRLDPSDYFKDLSLPDKQGLTPLLKLISLGRSRLLVAYFRCLEQVARPAQLMELFQFGAANQDNCLHELAQTGCLPALESFIDFLMSKLGPPAATRLMEQLARQQNAAGKKPLYPTGDFTHPMNYVLSLFTKGKAAEATIYLKTVQCAGYSAFFAPEHSMLFFTGPQRLHYGWKARPAMLPMEDVLLPGDLLEMLNSPERKR